MGNSAGGVSVCHHFASPLSQPLFQQVWSISGPCWSDSLNFSLLYGEQFVAQMGCNGSLDEIACMQSKSADELLNINIPYSKIENLPWAPVIDGHELTELPALEFESGNFPRKPFVSGVVQNEGVFLACNFFGVSESVYESIINNDYTSRFATPILRMYNSTIQGSAFEAYNNLVNESTFWCRVHRMLHAQGTFPQPAPPSCRSPQDTQCNIFHYVFGYHYNVSLARGFVPPPDSCINGAFHFLDIPFLFGVHAVPAPFNSNEQHLSNVMMSYLSNFLNTGNPNTPLPVPEWPRYSTQSPSNENQIFVTNTNPVQFVIQPAPRPPNCEFWDRLFHSFDELPGYYPQEFENVRP